MLNARYRIKQFNCNDTNIAFNYYIIIETLTTSQTITASDKCNHYFITFFRRQI